MIFFPQQISTTGFRTFSLFLILFSCFQLPALAQVDSLPAGADCARSKRISATRDYYSPVPPNGPGEILEFSGEDKFSLTAFENEHNTAWYAFSAPTNGTLTFEIVPDSLRDDYDFLLYSWDDSASCSGIMQKKILPVRSNIGRNDTSIQSMTGLSYLATDDFKHRGPGNSWSKPLPVNTGDRFVLVLDNVYEGGGNHLIRFHFSMDTVIRGVIRSDFDQHPLPADLFVQDDKTGEIVGKAQTDPETGAYSLPVHFEFGHSYHLVMEADGHFFREIPIRAERIRKFDLMGLDANLPALRPGRSFDMHTVLFVGNKAEVLPEAMPSLERLKRLMDNNPGLEVEIAGHTNGVGTITGRNWHYQLSKKRAETIKTHLVETGVSPEKITTEGYGCDKMVYPNGQTDEQLKKNRRVEVIVKRYEMIAD